MRKKKLLYVIISVSLVTATAFWGWKSYFGNRDDNTALPAVKADSRVVVEGIVVPIKSGELSFSIGGILAQIPVIEGQQVQAGQILVKLTNDELASKIDGGRADLNRAQAKYSQTKEGARALELASKKAQVDQFFAQYNLAKADFARMDKLYAQKAISGQEFDKTKAALQRAKAEWEQASADYQLLQQGLRKQELDAASADVSSAEAILNQAVAIEANTQLKAPFSGTVAFIANKIGEYVPAGTIVVRMGDFSAWRIETDDLTENQIAKVREGAKVMLTFDALPGVELGGKVISIRPFGEKKRGDITYKAVIEPERHEPQLKWNMTATVKIDTE